MGITPKAKIYNEPSLIEEGNDDIKSPKDINLGEEVSSTKQSLPLCAKTQRIHPIIIYPYTQSKSYKDLEVLYTNFVKKLDEDKDCYARPITVMNRQTYYTNGRYKYEKDGAWNDKFLNFRKDIIKEYSDILDAWCVDTCQMWLAGLGYAYDNRKSGEDIYWMIPGDFNYADKDIFDKLKLLPIAVRDHEQDLCVGEICVPVNSSKQLIDTYGTYGLLYNWFPQDAQSIRTHTSKPRTEFFAIRHSFLREILRQRWYAYEQMIVILLHGVIGKKRIATIELGDLTDLPQGRDTLAAAMQQVERTERVLKLFWRERNEQQADWPARFRVLDQQSEQIRGAALVILQNLLH